MIEHITLAGLDWILPVVIVVVTLVQWAAQRKEEKAKKGDKRPVTTPSFEPLEELMEALGNKPRHVSSAPLPPPPPRVVSPPRMKAAAQKTGKQTPPIKSSAVSAHAVTVPMPKKKDEKIDEVRGSLVELKHLQKSDLPSKEEHAYLERTAPQQSLLQAKRLKRSSRRRSLSELLRKRHRVRDAILINEILREPLALRE